jgi:hypothetical protein
MVARNAEAPPRRGFWVAGLKPDLALSLVGGKLARELSAQRVQ